MIEIEEETRDFLTINKKDFNEKKIEKNKKSIAPSNYESPYNIINGPYREHLDYSMDKKNLSLKKGTQDISEYLRKIRHRNTHLEKLYLKKIPRRDIIEREKKKSLKSIYQLDYSNDLDYPVLERKPIDRKTHQIYLPDDWIIPETIYNISYRDLRRLQISGNGVTQLQKIIKPDNLMPNFKQRKLFQVRTGDSEYACGIGATGNKLLKNKGNNFEDIEIKPSPNSDSCHCK